MPDEMPEAQSHARALFMRLCEVATTALNIALPMGFNYVIVVVDASEPPRQRLNALTALQDLEQARLLVALALEQMGGDPRPPESGLILPRKDLVVPPDLQ